MDAARHVEQVSTQQGTSGPGSNRQARRDLDSYGDPNDIGPDDPAPRASEGPSHTTVDGYQVWQFDPEAEARVPDGSGDNPINY